MPRQAGDEGERQEDQRHHREQQRPALDQLGAQIGQLLVDQRGSLAHRLQLLGHPREAVGRLAQVEAIIVLQPVRLDLGKLRQRLALGHDEAAIDDGVGSGGGDLAARFEGAFRIDRGLAIVDLVAQIG